MRRDFLVGKNRSSSNLSVVRACLVFLSLLLLSVKLIAHPAVVVIDPGHGGIDRGGMPGQRLPEKPYTLDVAKRLARILDGTDDLKVVLTWTGNYFVPLPWRTAIANREVGHRAVFVSIHFNAGWRQSAYGIETDLSLMAFPCFPCPCPLSPGCPQSLSRSFKNSSTPSNSFTSAKLIACAASLSTRPVFFHASHKSRMARAQTISDSMGQTTIL
jgi:N-acetylmuramoyl-L-alanine amidase